MLKWTSMKSPFLIPTMKWHGPQDPVTLQDLRQCGVEGVVTTLEQVPVGEVWTLEAVFQRKYEIEQSGLQWMVAESLPVHEAIKLGRKDREQYIDNYKTSLRHLKEAGVSVVVYNFMPLFDWLRTDWYFTMADGSMATAFDYRYMVVFDLFVLQRTEHSYTEEDIEMAHQLYESMSSEELQTLETAVLRSFAYTGLGHTLADLAYNLQYYDGMTRAKMRENITYFLSSIKSVVAELGLQLVIHPDDPPMDLLGIPRILRNAADIDWLLNAFPQKEIGLCFCSGALGSHPDNDVLDILRKWKHRVHFLHLRNVENSRAGIFHETGHLIGQVNLAALMKELSMADRVFPMRPDHGPAILEDLQKRSVNPGYTCIGRMKGLSALMGIEHALRLEH